MFPLLALNFEQVNATWDVTKFVPICGDITRAYSGHCQLFKIERFAKIDSFAKSYILDA